MMCKFIEASILVDVLDGDLEGAAVKIDTLLSNELETLRQTALFVAGMCQGAMAKQEQPVDAN